MKKIIISVLICSILGGCSLGQEEKEVNTKEEKIIVTEVYKQEKKYSMYKDFYLEKGDILIILSNNSWAICNQEKNIYTFQAMELGDWDYNLNSKEELENIIKTYISIKNTGYY